MRRQVRVSPHDNGGRRVHSKFRDYIHLHSKKEAIKNATEIAKRHKRELKIEKKREYPRYGNLYSGNPFLPKENRTIFCGRKPFPPKEYV